MLLTCEKSWVKWTPSDKEFLRDNFLNMTDIALSIRLGRSTPAIHMMKSRLGLTRPQYLKHTHTNIQLKRLRDVMALIKTVKRMKHLISLCEQEENNFKKDKYKAELKKLSGT